MIERLTGDRFLEELRNAEAWDIKANRSQELTLQIKNRFGAIVNIYLEPDPKTTDFYVYQKFATRLDRVVLYDSEVRRRRRA